MNDFNQEAYYKEEVSESQVAVYLAKVMGWMVVGLLTTFTTVLVCLASPTILTALVSNQYIFYGVMIAELIVVMAMSGLINRINTATATVLFMVYAALTGVTMTVITLLFQLQSVFFVFALTAGMFLAMALYGFLTKRDLTKLGSMALFGLFGLIIAGVFNMFMKNTMLDLIISIVGVLLFLGLTAFDTKKIKSFYIAAAETGLTNDSEPIRKASIYGALTLYLDFINMFLYLLRILGKRRR